MLHRAATVDFWWARPPQWWPLRQCTGTATAAKRFFFQNLSKIAVLAVLPPMAALIHERLSSSLVQTILHKWPEHFRDKLLFCPDSALIIEL